MLGTRDFVFQTDVELGAAYREANGMVAELPLQAKMHLGYKDYDWTNRPKKAGLRAHRTGIEVQEIRFGGYGRRSRPANHKALNASRWEKARAEDKAAEIAREKAVDKLCRERDAILARFIDSATRDGIYDKYADLIREAYDVYYHRIAS